MNKPSVVWVPGLMCDRTAWAPIWPAFEPFFVNSVADHRQAGQAEVDKRMGLVALAHSQGVRAMALEWVKGMVKPDLLDDQALIETIVAMMARPPTLKVRKMRNQAANKISLRAKCKAVLGASGLRKPQQAALHRKNFWSLI